MVARKRGIAMVVARSHIGLSTRSHAGREWPEIYRQSSFLLSYQFRDSSLFERFLAPIAPSSCPSLIAFLSICDVMVGMINLDVPVLMFLYWYSKACIITHTQFDCNNNLSSCLRFFAFCSTCSLHTHPLSCPRLFSKSPSSPSNHLRVG